MNDPREDEIPAVPIEELGQSYDALMSAAAWEVDKEDAQATLEPATPVTPPPLERIIEALLFVGGSPLTDERACETVRGLSPDCFVQAIDTLNREYRTQARPYVIRPHENGYVLSLRSRFLPLRDRLYGTVREARLSAAAIDVLALVAYRQPATKNEVDGLRGSDSGAILRQLVRRGLIAVVQRGDGRRREVSYGTTQRFLDVFGLANLDDLPQTQDLQML